MKKKAAETPTRDAFITTALERFKVGIEATRDQREREKTALAFQIPDKQWPEEIKNQRKAQTINGVNLPARPMLSIPTLDQPIQLILNQERAAHLGVQVHALTEDASDDTAEMLQGLYRNIEVTSRANLARSWAYERAVKCGRGAYRVNTVYDRDGGYPQDQKIVIQRLLYQESAVFDPFAQEPDWSDGRFAFVTSWMQFDRFKAKYPQSKLSGYSDEDVLALAAEAPDWIQGDKESRAVLIAEYWLVDGEDDDCCVYWSTITAVDTLEPEQRWNGKYIPLIPVIGRELIPFDGERRWTGVIEPNMDSAKLVNYAASNAVEIAALETKAQFDVDPKEIEGYEAWWQQANTRNFVYLPRHKILNGQVMPPIQRIQADMSRLGPSMSLLQMGKEFVHTGTGAFEPSLGQQTSSAKSGKAIQSLQQQHEQGNSHWLDNLAEISMTYEAKVILDLMPVIMDRPGRVERTLDIEGNKKTVMLNQPFVARKTRAIPVDPNNLPQGVQPDEVKHYDLTKGRYGVTVSVGKAYKSRLEEGNDMLGNLFQAEPELFKILGDIWLGFQSWPGHKAAEARMKKMLPPQLQDEADQQDPKLQLEQAKAALQQMQQQMQEMGKALETDKVKVDGQVEMAKIKAATDVTLQTMKDATSIEVARINAAKEALDAVREDAEEAIALNQTQQHDANQAAMDRQHEVNMAQQAHQQALQQGAQEHDAATLQADQAHGQALEQGDQGQAHALEQGQQAADLAPKPEPEQ